MIAWPFGSPLTAAPGAAAGASSAAAWPMHARSPTTTAIPIRRHVRMLPLLGDRTASRRFAASLVLAEVPTRGIAVGSGSVLGLLRRVRERHQYRAGRAPRPRVTLTLQGCLVTLRRLHTTVLVSHDWR